MLSDDDKRADYDGRTNSRQSPSPRSFQFESPQDIFSQFFGQSSLFNDPFFTRPWGGRHMDTDMLFGGSSGEMNSQRPFADSPFGMHSFSSGFTSSFSGYEGGGSTSRSQKTTIRNGVRETVTTTTDNQGNTTLERSFTDKNGRSSIERSVNGVRQVQGAQNQQTRMTRFN